MIRLNAAPAIIQTNIIVVFIVVSFAIGMKVPIILGKDGWSYIVFAYIFISNCFRRSTG